MQFQKISRFILAVWLGIPIPTALAVDGCKLLEENFSVENLFQEIFRIREFGKKLNELPAGRVLSSSAIESISASIRERSRELVDIAELLEKKPNSNLDPLRRRTRELLTEMEMLEFALRELSPATWDYIGKGIEPGVEKFSEIFETVIHRTTEAVRELTKKDIDRSSVSGKLEEVFQNSFDPAQPFVRQVVFRTVHPKGKPEDINLPEFESFFRRLAAGKKASRNLFLIFTAKNGIDIGAQRIVEKDGTNEIYPHRLTGNEFIKMLHLIEKESRIDGLDKSLDGIQQSFKHGNEFGNVYNLSAALMLSQKFPNSRFFLEVHYSRDVKVNDAVFEKKKDPVLHHSNPPKGGLIDIVRVEGEKVVIYESKYNLINHYNLKQSSDKLHFVTNFRVEMAGYHAVRTGQPGNVCLDNRLNGVDFNGASIVVVTAANKKNYDAAAMIKTLGGINTTISSIQYLVP